jgi:hypothetical protein
MNFFARFVRSLKALRLIVVTNQELGSNLTTLTLIPNSLSPKKSLTHRKVYPTKRLTDWKSEFVYTNSMNTNISRTFQNFKQE